MRGAVIVLVFLATFAGVTYFLLERQGLLGPEGVSLLWRLPAPREHPRAEQVEPAPLIRELREERAALERERELVVAQGKQLAEEREALDRQREAMAAELQAVREYRARLERQQQENVEALSRMLSNMDAEAAAQIVQKLPEPLAVDVLLKTKQRESGAILEAMAPDKAAALSERIARARLPTS